MKKLVIILSLILLCNLALAAPELQTENQNPQPGETYLATISGDIQSSIEKEDIKFLEGRREIFVQKDITKYDDTYYLYLYLTKEGNFTLQINQILYKQDGQLKETSISKELKVKKKIYTEEISQTEEQNATNKSYTKILSIKPGFFFSTETPEITLTNKGNETINATLSSNEISLNPDESKKISFQPNQSLTILNISSYKNFPVPIIYIGEEQNTTPEEYLKTDKEKISVSLAAKDEKTETIELFNFAEENISLEIETTMENIEINSPKEISAKSTANITITFSPNEQGYSEDNLTITYELQETEETYTLKIPLSVYTFPENTTEEEFVINNNTCSFFGGNLCSSNQKCEGDATYTSDGLCCLGTCSDTDENKNGGSYGWLIGIGIFIILGLVALFLFKKFKKTKQPGAKENLNQKSKTYQNRMSGKLSRS